MFLLTIPNWFCQSLSNKVKLINVRIFLSTCLLLIGFACVAQITISDQTRDLKTSEQLLEAGLWKAARNSFQDYKNSYGSSEILEYNLALCELKLNSSDEMISFIALTTRADLRTKGRIALGEYHFERNEFTKASKQLAYLDPLLYSKGDYARLKYKQGLSLYQSNQLDQAEKVFSALESLDFPESYKASYYLGSIQYEKGDLDEALRLFQRADALDDLIASTTPYIASTLYQLNRTDDLYAFADERIGLVDQANKSMLYHLKGEAYFNEESYELAASNLESGLKLNPRMSPEVYFKTGYAYDISGKKEKAIDYYKKTALSPSVYGQQAAFRLGQLYLSNNEKKLALGAFRTAGALNYDPEVKESSIFLTGKLESDLQNYSRSIDILERLLDDFPASNYQNEASELLSLAYARTSNYDAALAYFNRVSNPGVEIQRAYQRTCFQKATQLFNDQEFNEARKYLTKALSFPNDKSIAVQTQLLLGETLSLLGELDQAIQYYEQVMDQSTTDDEFLIQNLYGLGYAYYNTQQYDKALVQFQKLLRSNESGEILIRVADCYLALKDFNQGIQYYKDALSSRGTDTMYLLYQLGISYQLSDRAEIAREYFEKAYHVDERSHLADKAVLQWGISLFEDELFQESEFVFSLLINGYERSALRGSALLKRGLARLNLKKMKEAEHDFKSILSFYIDDPAAKDALLGLQTIRQRGFEVAEFDNYVESFREAYPEDESIQQIDFEQIKSYYFKRQLELLQRQVEAFIQKYPSSVLVIDAMYYLGDLYFQSSQWELCVEELDTFLFQTNHPYFGRALDKRGRSLLAIQEPVVANQNYYRLLNHSNNGREDYLAFEGLLRSYLMLEELDSALVYTNRLRQNQWKPLNGDNMIDLFAGKIYMDKKQIDSALFYLTKVSQLSTDAIGAESTYLIAYIHYDLEDYRTSLDVLFDVTSRYSGYSSWVDESYLLMVDNYTAMGEIMQAQATLQSIIDYSQDDVLKERAQQKLIRLEESLDRSTMDETDTIDD